MTTILKTTRRPDVSFYANGRIDITARVTKALNLSEGDCIGIAVVDNDFLLYKKYQAAEIVGRHEARLRITKRGKYRNSNMRTNSRTLCAAILSAVGNADKARLPVGNLICDSQLGPAMPIITKLPLYTTSADS